MCHQSASTKSVIETIAKKKGELTHEIVHNASMIAICHSIDCDNVAVIYKPCALY